jgi:hypothetical protein
MVTLDRSQQTFGEMCLDGLLDLLASVDLIVMKQHLGDLGLALRVYLKRSIVL